MRTNIGRSMGMEGNVFDHMLDAYQDKLPLKRIGQAEDIANLACFLASDDAINMTGSIVVSDGGLLLGENA